MSPGKFVRSLLGPSLFRHVGKAYRAIFVDLQMVAKHVAPLFPADAHILDIGGGDGEPLNYLLRLRPDLRVTMIDTGESIGDAIDYDLRSKVTRLSQTSVRDYSALPKEPIGGVLICDVVHHIAPAFRAPFLADVRELVGERGAMPIVIKDVEPGSFISTLSYLSDRYVTGDRNVALVSRSEMIGLIGKFFERAIIVETKLYAEDRPNYALAFST